MSTSNVNRIECRRLTRQATKLLKSSEVQIPDLFVSRPQHRRSKRLMNGEITNPKDQKKLDTNNFEFYLEYLWSKISEEKRISYTYFDCLWFSLYKNGSAKSRVLQWIKRKQIFLRRYIFVPILCWKHWSLLVLCHFGEKRSPRTKQPFMLLLDSLQNLDPKRLEPDIRRLVTDIYRSEGRKENDEFISKIPLLIPKVPQQRNGEECGIYVLYFLFLFLESVPDSFSQEGCPYFLNEDWFKLEDLESFKEEIHTSWMEFQTHSTNKNANHVEELENSKLIRTKRMSKDVLHIE